MRKMLLKAHLVAGLITAPFLIVLGLSGAVMVFENEIDEALNAKLVRVQPEEHVLSLQQITEKVQEKYPGERVGVYAFPERNDRAMMVAAGRKALFVNPYTGEILGEGSQASNAMGKLHQFHLRLLAGPVGATVVSCAAVVLIFLALSGMVLWWPGKIFSVRPGGSGKRLVFHLHNALGFYSSAFLLLFALTAVVIHWEEPARRVVAAATHSSDDADFPRAAPACAEAPALPADELLADGMRAVPGAVPTMLALGRGATPVRIAFKYPEDRTPAGRTNVFLERCTGKILLAQSERTASRAFRYTRMWNREIHTGDIFGWPSRILACLFSLSLPLMALTGPLIWWNRRRRG